MSPVRIRDHPQDVNQQNQPNMKEQNLKKWAEQQYRLKVSKLINSVTIAQTVADQTLQFANKCMTAQEREDSDACRAMENLSCVCEETLRVLCEELNRGTRLYEVLESGNTDLAILAQQD